MEVKLTAGVVVWMIDKEKREGQWPVQGQARLRSWSMGGATGRKLCNYLAQRSKVRKEKPPWKWNLTGSENRYK